MTVSCPNCGVRLKPELRVRLRSSAKHLDLLMIPEIERSAYYLGALSLPSGAELVIGYPELFERARMLADGLRPEAVEVLKFWLLEKAQDESPEAEIGVSYAGLKEGRLSFQLTGLRQGQVAILPVDPSVYQKTESELKGTATKEPFARMLRGPYRSIRVLEMLEEGSEAS